MHQFFIKVPFNFELEKEKKDKKDVIGVKLLDIY